MVKPYHVNSILWRTDSIKAFLTTGVYILVFRSRFLLVYAFRSHDLLQLLDFLLSVCCNASLGTVWDGFIKIEISYYRKELPENKFFDIFDSIMNVNFFWVLFSRHVKWPSSVFRPQFNDVEV